MVKEVDSSQIAPPMKMLDALMETATSAKMELINATSTKAEQMIREYTKLFSSSISVIKEVNGMRQADVDEVESFVDDIKKISRRTFPSDIRSWQAKSVQRQDAIASLDNFIFAMSKALDRWTKMTPEQRSKAVMAGVPNYKFGIGENVKVVATGRHGKVIEYGKENGTGKQYYKIRVTGVDNPKIYGRNDLSKHDG